MKSPNTTIKNTLFLLLCFVFSLSDLQAQVDETPDAYYKWKKDKTELQKGYVVLISGKRMDGMIALKTKDGAMKTIEFVGDGKELKLPAKSVSAYGLTSKPAINDSPEDLYKWRNGAVVMGKTQQQTAPRQGYVILQDGRRISGTLQLKKIEDRLEQFKMNSGGQNYKYSPDEITNYGLEPTIAELNKNGAKVYKQAGKNFHPGWAMLNNGEEKKGMIAFKTSELINPMKPVAGHKYSNIYYAENENAFVGSFRSEEVAEVVQTINGVETRYQYYNGFFIPMGAMDQLTYKDKTREFQPGTILFPNGEQRSGEVAQTKTAMTFYTHSVNFKDETGLVTLYDGDQIESFTQTFDGERKEYFAVQGVFVEKMFEGSVFRLCRNPFPTTENKFLNSLAQGAASVGTTVAANAISTKVANDNALMSKESTEEFRETMNNASAEELAQMERDIQAGINSLDGNDAVSKEARSGLEGQLLAVQMASASREISSAPKGSPGIKKKEWIIHNVKTGEEIIVIEAKYKDQVEHLLMGCYTYLGMNKSEQKSYVKFGNLKKAVELLDACY